MTATLTEPTAAARHSRSPGRLAAIVVGAVALLGLAAFIWVTAEHSIIEDRLRNPDPVPMPFDAAGRPRAHEPVWGIDNWPMVLTLLFTIVPLILLAFVAMNAIRRRRMSHRIVVFLVIATMASLDTYGAWASFTIYNPQFVHFPTTWPWAALSPTVQPVFTIIGYPFFYFTPGMLAILMYEALRPLDRPNRRFIRRAKPGGFVDRHPLVVVWIIGFLTMVCFDVPLELLSMRVDMYFYSEYIAPAIHWDWVALPFMEVLVASTMTGIISILLFQHADGWTVMGRGAERFSRFFDRIRAGKLMRQYLVGVVIGWGCLFTLFTIWATMRVTLPHEAFDGQWHYGETATYDPHHRLADDHAKEGPFYGDFWQDIKDFLRTAPKDGP